MKTKLSNPLWTHSPAIVVVIIFVVYTIIAGPLPIRAAIHFNASGMPDDYGSPYLVFGIVTGLSILLIAISAIIDDIWARYERKKIFNWLCLLDELTVGALGGIYLGYVNQPISGTETFNFPWSIFLLTIGAVIALGVVLEFLRPFTPHPGQIVYGDTATLEKELTQRMKESAYFLHWESQNPFWVSLLAVIVPLVLIASAALTWSQTPWVAPLQVLIAIVLFMLYGGFRTSVTPQEITVRFGIPGIKVLRLNTAEIAGVELVSFAPIGDFGGYGIRMNREMTAYYLRGSRGVKLTTFKGKKYLIGSDRPEELYTIIRTMAKHELK